MGIFFGITASPPSFGFSAVFYAPIIAFGFFVLSSAFFGMLSPLLFLFFGLAYSTALVQNPVGVTAMLVSLVLASYFGNILGEAAEKDLNKKAAIAGYRKKVFFGAAFAVAAAALAGYVFELNLGTQAITQAQESAKSEFDTFFT